MTNERDSDYPHKNGNGNPTPSVCRLVRYLKGKYYECRTNKKKEPAQEKAARITARATRWIAIFTVVLGVVGILQVWIIIRGEKSLIAPIIIETVPSPLTKDHIFTIRFEIENWGKAAALITGLRVGMTNLNLKDLPDMPNYANDTQSVEWRAVILPDQKIYLVATPFNRSRANTNTPWDEKDVQSANDGTFHVRIYGYIEYEDTPSFFPIFFASLFTSFSEPRRTGFCFEYNPSRMPDADIPNMFNLCGNKNFVYVR